jgi:hypothetical protein
MTILFKVIDPRGNTITCSNEQWQYHVIQNKPFMQPYLAEVKSTLQNPDFICQDAEHQKRQCYYARKIRAKLYIKVIVDFKTDKDAELITAFLADNGKKGEIVIWPPLKS